MRKKAKKFSILNNFFSATLIPNTIESIKAIIKKEIKGEDKREDKLVDIIYMMNFIYIKSFNIKKKILLLKFLNKLDSNYQFHH